MNSKTQQFSLTTSNFNPLVNVLEPADYNVIAHTAAQIISSSAKQVAHTVRFESIEVYADKNSYMLLSMDSAGTITWWDDARQDDATMFNGQLSYIATAMSNAVNDALRKLAPMFTVTQAATLAACNVAYIRAEIAAGRLPAEKVGSQWIIARVDFDAWMANPKRGSRQVPQRGDVVTIDSTGELYRVLRITPDGVAIVPNTGGSETIVPAQDVSIYRRANS